MKFVNNKIKKLGASCHGKKKVDIQLMGILIYHSEISRKAKTNLDILKADTWMEWQTKYAIIRYINTLGDKRKNVYFDISKIIKTHSRKSVEGKRESHIENCNLWGEIELKKALNSYLTRIGIEQIHLL